MTWYLCATASRHFGLTLQSSWPPSAGYDHFAFELSSLQMSEQHRARHDAELVMALLVSDAGSDKPDQRGVFSVASDGPSCSGYFCGRLWGLGFWGLGFWGLGWLGA